MVTVLVTVPRTVSSKYAMSLTFAGSSTPAKVTLTSLAPAPEKTIVKLGSPFSEVHLCYVSP